MNNSTAIKEGMKLSISVLMLLSITFFSNAQMSTVSGGVIDKMDQKPIEFATLTLLNPEDSSMISGTISNVEGKFEMQDVPYGSYLLRAKFIGFNSFYTSLTINGAEHIVPIIELEVSKSLETVEVTAEESPFVTKIDKKVFNAESNLVAKGGTGIDLLQQVPTITVDENGTIQMRGNTSVTILINGRPSAMPPSQLLAQIPASSIEKVELITNPSAKYDPEGIGGIINIVLKKNKLKGFNGSVQLNAGYGRYPKLSGSINLNYRNSWTNLYASYGYDWRRTYYGGSQDRDVLLADSTWDRLRQTDTGERINTAQNIRSGADFFINDNNTLYLSANLSLGENLGTRLVDYNQVNSGEDLLSYSTRDGRIDVPSRNNVFNAGWQKTFKNKEHTLDVDFNYAISSLIADERLQHDYYSTTNLLDYTDYQNTLDDNSFITSVSKIDYVLPITDSLKFEAGFHYTYRFSNSAFLSESGSDGTTFYNDTAISNRFIYLQNTFAPYSIISRQWPRFGVQFGLRLEPTLTSSELLNTNEQFENNYVELFPSLHMSYQAKNNLEVQLSYSKRINRPGQGQLNPFSNYSDPLTLQTGNPFLLPEIIHVNEFSILKRWKKFNINTTLYYRYISNLIRRNLTNEESYSIVSFTNLGSSHLSGADLILTFLPIKGMRIMSSTSIYNTSTKDEELTGGEYTHYLGANTSLYMTYRTKSNWFFQLWGSYSPVRNVIQGIILPNYGFGGGIQKGFYNNKLRIGLRVTDVLKTRQFTFESYDLGNYTFDSQRLWESRQVFLNITYSFGKMLKGKERRQSKVNDSNDERNVPQMQ